MLHRPGAGPSHYCPSDYNGAEWSQEVLAIGTPAIWWGSILALLFCLGWWLLHRDWRAGAVLLGVLAGWGPWFPLVSRTKFYYYALEFEPFLILSIVLCLGLILGPASASALRRSTGAGIVGAYLLCVLLMFWYFYPILAGKVIPYPDWLQPYVVPDRQRLDLSVRTGRVHRPGSGRLASAHPLSWPSGYVQLSWASYVYAVSRRAGELAASDVICATTGDVSGPAGVYIQ